MRKLMIIASALLILAACGNSQKEAKEVKLHELEDRSGVAYLLNTDKPFTGTAYAYYSDGISLYQKSDFVDGKQHGEFIEYFQNGQISYKIFYKEGIEDGEWVWYTDGGTLIKRVNYNEGKLHGEWISYYDNGQVWLKGQYENGEEVGEWFAYDEEGNQVER